MKNPNQPIRSWPPPTCLKIVTLLLALTATASAADWPTFRHDNTRSARSSESLPAAELGLAWLWQSAEPPQPAWAGPAKWDAYNDIPRLNRTFPHYCVVKVNNVFNNPVERGGTRWIPFPKPHVIFQYYNGLTGELDYAETIHAP